MDWKPWNMKSSEVSEAACVAYFKRGEMLLERVDMVLDVLRRGSLGSSTSGLPHSGRLIFDFDGGALIVE